MIRALIAIQVSCYSLNSLVYLKAWVQQASCLVAKQAVEFPQVLAST